MEGQHSHFDESQNSQQQDHEHDDFLEQIMLSSTSIPIQVSNWLAPGPQHHLSPPNPNSFSHPFDPLAASKLHQNQMLLAAAAGALPLSLASNHSVDSPSQLHGNGHIPNQQQQFQHLPRPPQVFCEEPKTAVQMNQAQPQAQAPAPAPPTSAVSTGGSTGTGTGTSTGTGTITAPQRQRVRARRGQATDPHSIAERLRRERIAERMKGLQELVPNANKTDKASMLDDIIDYVKFLQLQVKVLSMSRLGGAAGVAPLVADMSSEGGGGGGGVGRNNNYNGNQTNESMTMTEQQVAKLMEEDMGSAMQYLQGKGLCLMPISLATAISTATCHSRINPLPPSRPHRLNDVNDTAPDTDTNSNVNVGEASPTSSQNVSVKDTNPSVSNP